MPDSLALTHDVPRMPERKRKKIYLNCCHLKSDGAHTLVIFCLNQRIGSQQER